MICRSGSGSVVGIGIRAGLLILAGIRRARRGTGRLLCGCCGCLC